jgi:hypothetical protein
MGTLRITHLHGAQALIGKGNNNQQIQAKERPDYRFESLWTVAYCCRGGRSLWMIRNNLTTETRVPNFNNYIYEDVMKAVKPGAVNTIR